MGWLKDLKLNRHLGQWAFTLQRITGVLLAIYLIPHILLNSSALIGGEKYYNDITARVQKFHILEIAIVVGVAFHLFNGLRIILIDFFELSRYQKRLLWGAGFFTLLMFLYAIIVYIPKILS